MSESPDPKQTDETKIITPSGTIKIEQPHHRRNGALQKVSVMIDPAEEVAAGFVSFLRENAIIALAVGFAIGSQAQSVIKQLIASFIDPASQLLFGRALSKNTFTWHLNGRAADFGWGAMFYALLNFIFVLGAIYFIIKLLNLDELDKPKKK